MQNQSLDTEICLPDRRLIRVAGADAADFLQNVMTNDIRRVTKDALVYACLLTPQGQILHDFFVVQGEDGYLLDVAKSGAEDFFQRLKIFRLRSKVTLDIAEDAGVFVGGATGLADVRLQDLPKRRYARGVAEGSAGNAYDDVCISLGVPDTSAIKTGRDVVADVNYDFLNAIAWDKGCFIGQEVTARMRYRGLAKKRMMIVEGAALATGELLNAAGGVAGDIRQVSKDGKRALAIVRLRDKDADLCANAGQPVRIQCPPYLDI